MSLREELDAPQTGGTQCLTCTFIAEQSPTVQAEWNEMLADEGLETGRLHKLARRKGFQHTLSAFRHHRVQHQKVA